MLSVERILRILESLGLTRPGAEIYVYLAKTGLKKEEDLTDTLKLGKKQLYSSLKDLQSKGIVTSSIEESALFYCCGVRTSPRSTR